MQGHLQPGQVTATSVTLEVSRALALCRQTFKEQVVDKIRLLSGGHGSQIFVPVMQTAVGATPSPSHQENQIVLRRFGGSPRAKRVSGDFFLGTFASTILTYANTRVLGSARVEQAGQSRAILNQTVARMQQQLRSDHLASQPLPEQARLTAKLVEHNVQHIAYMETASPQLTVVATNKFAKMHLTRSHLDQLRLPFRA